MRLKIVLFCSLFFIGHALTPFSLSNLQELSVLVEKKSAIDLKLKATFEKMMRNSLTKLGVKHDGYFNDVLTILPSIETIGDTKLVSFTLVVIGQVKREHQTESVFGITYQLKDTIEFGADFEQEAIDSIEFLLSEFSEQYIEDNEE